jgi:hypothetical protein
MFLKNIWKGDWVGLSTFLFKTPCVAFIGDFPSTFSPLQKDEIWLQMQHRNNVINKQKPKWSSKHTFYLFSFIWRESFGCQEWAHSSPLKTEGNFFLLLVLVGYGMNIVSKWLTRASTIIHDLDKCCRYYPQPNAFSTCKCKIQNWMNV